jgi:glycosyltransferase involved in cell wall biosynthesis
MKITYVCAGLANPIFYPYGGAIEKLVGETVERLGTHFKIELIGNIYGRNKNVDVLNYERLISSIRPIPFSSPFYEMLIINSEITPILLRRSTDLVVSVYYVNLPACILKAKTQNTPLIFWEYDHTLYYYHDILDKSKKVLLKSLLKFPNKIVVPSNALKTRITKTGIPNEQVEVIPNAVDTSKFCPTNEEKKNFIVYVGKVTPHKGVLYLIQAFARARTKLKEDYKLIIIGPKVGTHAPSSLLGGYYKKCEYVIAKYTLRDSVIFMDHISELELISYLRKAKIFVFPSFEEAFGLALLEAMACGLPCIVNKVQPLMEVVGDAGVVTDVRDTVEFANTLIMLLEDRELQRKLGVKARLRAEKFFSWDVVIPRITHFLNEVAAS